MWRSLTTSLTDCYRLSLLRTNTALKETFEKQEDLALRVQWDYVE